jgi:hypothetical protein
LKHVFVESNFIIELARPFAGPDAGKLFGRQGADVQLHVPWAAVVESKRTLGRIIREDLGFDDTMQKFGARQLKSALITTDELKVLQRFAKMTSLAREDALKKIGADVDGAVAKMSVIEPTKEVILKTLSIYQVKSLQPFDEMIMGAVLTRAEELVRNGATDLFFCNLNKKDFDPTNRPELAAEYADRSMTYLSGFKVPN